MRGKKTFRWIFCCRSCRATVSGDTSTYHLFSTCPVWQFRYGRSAGFALWRSCADFSWVLHVSPNEETLLDCFFNFSFCFMTIVHERSTLLSFQIHICFNVFLCKRKKNQRLKQINTEETLQQQQLLCPLSSVPLVCNEFSETEHGICFSMFIPSPMWSVGYKKSLCVFVFFFNCSSC